MDTIRQHGTGRKRHCSKYALMPLVEKSDVFWIYCRNRTFRNNDDHIANKLLFGVFLPTTATKYRPDADTDQIQHHSVSLGFTIKLTTTHHAQNDIRFTPVTHPAPWPTPCRPSIRQRGNPAGYRENAQSTRWPRALAIGTVDQL